MMMQHGDGVVPARRKAFRRYWKSGVRFVISRASVKLGRGNASGPMPPSIP